MLRTKPPHPQQFGARSVVRTYKTKLTITVSGGTHRCRCKVQGSGCPPRTPSPWGRKAVQVWLGGLSKLSAPRARYWAMQPLCSTQGPGMLCCG